MNKEFPVSKNIIVGMFLLVYFGSGVYQLLVKGLNEFLVIMGVGVFLLLYFFGIRPYKYTVDKRTLYYHYRLRKNKEVDLMQCEVICDPVPRIWELMLRANAIEIYTNVKKRYRFYPKERVEFVEAVLRGNKRIHCTVQDYTDVHRKLAKKQRKERIKAERAAQRAKREAKEKEN